MDYEKPMAENDDHPHPQDRRLQTLVYELDKRVHGLETSDAMHKLEVAYLKGEVVGIRSSTATSSEVAAASQLTNERIIQLRNEVHGIKSVMIWTAVTIVGIILGALQFKLVVIP